MNTLLKFLLYSSACLATAAYAADAPASKVMGWSKSANLGTNLSYSSSEGVVGQTDGSSQTYGLNTKGSLNHGSDHDEWRNTLSILENTSKTPSIPRFVKSGDEFKFNTSYLYDFESVPTVGPYVSGELSAPLFKGEDVRATTTTYRYKLKDGSAGNSFTGQSARLTDGFRPLNTKESIGAYWKPVQEDNIKVEGRLGFGALQINANGQYAVDGTNAANEVVLKELANVNQAGLEASLGVKGKVNDTSTYEAGVDALVPFINDKPAGDDRNAFRLTNVDGFAKYSSNITSWMALAYDYKLKIQPQLVDRAQQIHMVVLNINYNLF